MKKLLLIFTLALVANLSFASQTTATSSGDWTDAIWSNGEPGCIDTVIIPAGITVDIGSGGGVDIESCPDSIIIFLYGHINFSNGKKLKLPCLSDILLFPGSTIGVGSGGGSSTYIEMCGTQYWNASSGDLAGPTVLCDGGCPPSQLPIELLYFTAELITDKREVDLNWATASESDNLFFTVERSQNAIDWEFVTTQDGALNSSVVLYYQDVDLGPYMGVSYYRLKQTDTDGGFQYSPIVSVNQSVDSGLLVYMDQTSSNGSIVITFPSSAAINQDVRIFDFSGKLVYEKTFDISQSSQCIVQIDPSWESGAYVLRTSGEAIKLVMAK